MPIKKWVLIAIRVVRSRAVMSRRPRHVSCRIALLTKPIPKTALFGYTTKIRSAKVSLQTRYIGR